MGQLQNLFKEKIKNFTSPGIRLHFGGCYALDISMKEWLIFEVIHSFTWGADTDRYYGTLDYFENFFGYSRNSVINAIQTLIKKKCIMKFVEPYAGTTRSSYISTVDPIWLNIVSTNIFKNYKESRGCYDKEVDEVKVLSGAEYLHTELHQIDFQNAMQEKIEFLTKRQAANNKRKTPKEFKQLLRETDFMYYDKTRYFRGKNGIETLTSKEDDISSRSPKIGLERPNAGPPSPAGSNQSPDSTHNIYINKNINKEINNINTFFDSQPKGNSQKSEINSPEILSKTNKENEMNTLEEITVKNDNASISTVSSSNQTVFSSKENKENITAACFSKNTTLLETVDNREEEPVGDQTSQKLNISNIESQIKNEATQLKAGQTITTATGATKKVLKQPDVSKFMQAQSLRNAKPDTVKQAEKMKKQIKQTPEQIRTKMLEETKLSIEKYSNECEVLKDNEVKELIITWVDCISDKVQALPSIIKRPEAAVPTVISKIRGLVQHINRESEDAEIVKKCVKASIDNGWMMFPWNDSKITGRIPLVTHLPFEMQYYDGEYTEQMKSRSDLVF